MRSPSECVGTLAYADLPPPSGLESAEEGRHRKPMSRVDGLLFETDHPSARSKRHRARYRDAPGKDGPRFATTLRPEGETARWDDERQLVQALRERDEHAFEEVVDRHWRSMFHLAQSYVRCPEDAEEVVQETWLAVLNGLDRFEGRSTLKTWIFRILANRARTRGRRGARMQPFSSLRTPPLAVRGDDSANPEWLFLTRDPVELPWHGNGWSPMPADEQVVTAEIASRIHAAIEALPPRLRTIIQLRDIEDRTSAEVCELMEISEANQRVLLHRARRRVGALMSASSG